MTLRRGVTLLETVIAVTLLAALVTSLWAWTRSATRSAAVLSGQAATQRALDHALGCLRSDALLAHGDAQAPAWRVEPDGLHLRTWRQRAGEPPGLREVRWSCSADGTLTRRSGDGPEREVLWHGPRLTFSADSSNDSALWVHWHGGGIPAGSSRLSP